MAYVRGELPGGGRGAVTTMTVEVRSSRGTTHLVFAWPAGQLPVAGGIAGNRCVAACPSSAMRSAWRGSSKRRRSTSPARPAPIGGSRHWNCARRGAKDRRFPAGKHRWQCRAPRACAGRCHRGWQDIGVSARFGGEGLMLAVGAQLRSWKHGEEAFGPGELALEVRRLDPSALMPLLRDLPALSRPAEASTAVPATAPGVALPPASLPSPVAVLPPPSMESAAAAKLHCARHHAGAQGAGG